MKSFSELNDQLDSDFLKEVNNHLASKNFKDDRQALRMIENLYLNRRMNSEEKILGMIYVYTSNRLQKP
jgi:hypothetical protein